MVKPAKDDDQYLLFAPGYACENWIRIPLSSIETLDLLNFVPCNEHTHPLVLLHLKQPETDEARLFSSLAQATSGQARNMLSITRQRRYNREPLRFSRSSASPAMASRTVPLARDHAPAAPRGVDDNGWFGILVDCDATTCTYEEY